MVPARAGPRFAVRARKGNGSAPMRRIVRPRSALLAGLVVLTLAPGLAHAVGEEDRRPYDSKLVRLAEILGAVHYLRGVCGENDGLVWHEHMRQLIENEGTSAYRRALLTRSFNSGYRSYSRTYSSCTASAKTAVQRFITEGAALAEGL
ncbi:MAG: TIGR02301 family protein, partial [Hyphomicrobiaceae bacterium]|nr:TIGR02301 family protein [Hyphomicrobiaceae bacterium]